MIAKVIRKIAGIINGPLRMIDYSDRFEGSCVLTFDDGPNENTIRILDALKGGDVHGATFVFKEST